MVGTTVVATVVAIRLNEVETTTLGTPVETTTATILGMVATTVVVDETTTADLTMQLVEPMALVVETPMPTSAVITARS